MFFHTKLYAISYGVADAARLNLTKPDDVALCVMAALTDAGYTIVRKPHAKGAQP